MCGITGFYSPKVLRSSGTIVMMNDAIKHRGPDDEGFWTMNGSKKEFFSGEDTISTLKTILPPIPSDEKCSAAVGFRRLSILDLSDKGHQPMSNVTGDIIITFNGEIYNFKQLRKELEENGFQFESETDTEVILKGYEAYGNSIFEKLDGMFAICIFDQAIDKIILARDRMGLKPLFYHKTKDSICWASEIKAILKADWIVRKINWEGVYTNFRFQTTLVPQTCFAGIFSVEPGTYISITGKGELECKTTNFWRLPSTIHKHISEKEAADTVEKLLYESVKKQLYADVPLVVMMSGGIDSTLVMSKAYDIESDVSAFTLDYQYDNDEVKNAEKIAAIKNFKHHVYRVSESDITKSLKDDIQHFEEPYISIEVLVHAANIAKHHHYKVVLSGNGADELFGGYKHLQKFLIWKKRRRLRFLKNFIPPVNSFTQKIKNYWSQKDVFDFFSKGQIGFQDHEIRKLFKKDYFDAFDSSLKSYRHNENLEYSDYFRYDMKYSLSSHHVFRDDLSAMRHSVEFRYPYLSNELIDFVAQLPQHYRFNGKINKPLLREVAKKELPKEILQMPKLGFTFPLARLMNDNIEVRTLAEKSLDLLRKRGIFNNDAIDNMVSNPISEENASKIWQLITFELWLQKYFDATV